jgi:hypothetical protein
MLFSFSRDSSNNWGVVLVACHIWARVARSFCCSEEISGENALLSKEDKRPASMKEVKGTNSGENALLSKCHCSEPCISF